MEYTGKMLTSFLKKLIAFDKDSRAVIGFTAQLINEREINEKNEWLHAIATANQRAESYGERAEALAQSYQKQLNDITQKDVFGKSEVFDRLQKCKEQLLLITAAENCIADKSMYSSASTSQMTNIDLSVEDILKGRVDLAAKAIELNELLSQAKKKESESICASFYNLCRKAETLLNKEIISLRSEIGKNRDSLRASYDTLGKESHERFSSSWVTINAELEETIKHFSAQRDSSRQQRDQVFSSANADMSRHLKELVERFCKEFPPEELEEEYKKIYAMEPSFETYACYSGMPRNMHIGSLEYDLMPLGLCEFTKSFLERYYYFMFRGNKIQIPHCASFGPEFNYLFKFHEDERTRAVKDACDLGMRMFMMLPPGKLNCMFIDPVRQGDSFAMFWQLVDVNDKTNEIINGQIWSNPADIEEKLRVMTDHISNVTQRCLQGKYESIYEYNQDAEQNSEAYQVLMLMDFPAGLTEQSLRYLEQIATTGPKCGVFTILYRNESQFKKISEQSQLLVSNIENSFQEYNYPATSTEGIYSPDSIRGKPLIWKKLAAPEQNQLKAIIETLKHGIKNAEKVVVEFSKIIPDKSEWFQGDCSKELSIPIGIHGAKNIQNLSFGLGGSHHALIAGQTGSGKSSLLHTIIMSALIKYPANQLQIFLVDFKRGVEFKIYANYSLENFKVIAIESEREFGCSVLEYLEKEQSSRADKFKKVNVDNVEDYRKKSGEVLPRVLLIIDEFHVLFSKDTSDTDSKKSSNYLEQIIRQGRAFGIHVILASQTMSNIGGINYGVWGQVGVRIALKCPKADAKFVLGSDNEGIDLLSADNPGQAIYNSDCGNSVANTVFRVAYIEQEEQDAYLQYISAHEPRFHYPATRIMLSNVEDNIYNPLQRFARGENYEFMDCMIHVGEPLKLINNMKMIFKQKRGSNMLVIGNDEQKARTLFTFAALSLSLHTLTKHDYHAPAAPAIYLFDYAPLEVFEERDDTLLLLAQKIPGYIKYIPFDEAEDAIKELYQIFKRREKGTGQNEEVFMLVYGLQRARNLRSSDVYKKNIPVEEYDEFGDDLFEESARMPVNSNLTVKPYDMFLNLLQRGSSFGIYSIIWEDNFKLFMNSYADMLPNFDMRIAFTMPDDDSINFIEEVNGSKISENGAIYNFNGNQKFRPYKKPDAEWLESICSRITQFEKK